MNMATKLSDYFIGIAAKRLSSSEIISNQHEINGVKKFKNMLGDDRSNSNGFVIYLPDNEDSVIFNESTFTWYDVRLGNPDRASEFRLYYSDSEVIPNASKGDLLILGKNVQDELVIIVSPKGSTSEKQLLWLFGLEELENKFIVKDFRGNKEDVGFAGKYILESLGVTIEDADLNYLDEMISRFGMEFPSTRVFSEYSRSTVKNVSIIDNPDEALMTWWDREGTLLRTFEAEIIKERLKEGFGENVDDFIAFSLSVINRRKSRAGHSLENHLETIFIHNGINYTKGGRTERNSRPDFIFPNIESYHKDDFNTEMLTMLGVKTTLKDRWRQVLAEAERIERKHLITLEPAISKNQTDEIIANKLQLVIPAPLFQTYTSDQSKDLISLKDFICYVASKS